MNNKVDKKTMGNKKPRLIPKLRFPEFRDEREWAKKEVKDIFEITRGYVLSMGLVKDTRSENAPYPVYSSQTKNNGLAGYYSDFLYEDAITWTTDGANAGDVNYRPGKFYCTNVCGVLINRHGYANSCIAALINSVSKQYVSYVGNPKLMNGVMAKIALPFPTVREQKKIAGCLSSIDELITLEAQKLEALKSHKKGLMQQLFPADGETLPKLRFPEFRNEGEWQTQTLDKVATITSGGTPSRSEPEYWGGSIPWVTTSLIDFNTIKNAEEFITSEGLNNSSAKLFPSNTLLMAMYGQGKTRGKVALLGIEATTNQACAAVSFDKKIDTNFAFQNLASRYEEIRKLSNEGGQENLSAGLIKEIPLTYPTFPEQRKIANCLSNIDNLISTKTQKIEALKFHKKGLMQQLFPVMDEV